MSLLPLLFSDPPTPFSPTPTPPMSDFIRVECAPAGNAFTVLPTWVDFTDTLREVEWEYRRDGGPTGQCVPSRATFVVSNRDGRWDPATGLGGATWAGRIRRWLQIRITISNDAFFTRTVMFRGHIDDVECYSTEFDSWAIISAVDQLGMLAEFNLEDLERPAELAGVRASAIFDVAGLSNFFSDIEHAGIVPLTADTLRGQALAAAQECARSEGGHLWCSRNGMLRWTDRHYFYDTFSRSNFAMPATIIKALAVNQRLAAFENVSVGASSGATGAVRKFGTPDSGFPASTRRELSTRAIWNADSFTLAEWLQRHGNFFGTRVQSVTCDVLSGSTTVLDGLVAGTLKWLDTVDVSFTPSHGAATSQLCWVESERHRATAEGEWTVQLGLSPYQTDYANVAANFLQFGQTIGSRSFGR